MMDNRKYETAILEIFREAPEKYDAMIAGKDDPFLFAACSNLRNALICWYPLDKNQTVLQIGAGYGALTGYLADHCGSIAILYIYR